MATEHPINRFRDDDNSTPGSPSPRRPNFHHQVASDRLREGSYRAPYKFMGSSIRKGRKSMFKELGLDTDLANEGATSSAYYSSDREFAEITGLHSASTSRIAEQGRSDDRLRQPQTPESATPTDGSSSGSSSSRNKQSWYAKLTAGRGRRPRIKSGASPPPPMMAGVTRFATIALLIAVVLPGFSYYNGHGEKVVVSGAEAGPIHHETAAGAGPILESRADSPTQVCRRWSHQVALLNGTLYMYGGQVKTTADQKTDTWNNNFLTLDLTKSWDASSPALSGLPQPSGPPAVSNGYLWNDYNNLFMYGGEFADNPYVTPSAPSTWKYNVKAKLWTELQNPQTSAGNKSSAGALAVQRAAEGAGLSVPELGVSWYFGGHLDWATTPGWSTWTNRTYLKSLLEFTHPGYTNDGVQSLANGVGAGDSGVYRNITEGGLQTDTAFSERADGALVFVPGWGERGILIGLAGGTDVTFASDLSTLDVYDIQRSVWYTQQTTGTPPGVRVNPCTVIASAPDASSFQIYLFGGQNLIPFGSQTQYSDMYILSIPAFTWIKADQGGTVPYGRSGHTCTLRDGQLVLVGGYIDAAACDSPGIHIFNASSLAWTDRFNALDHEADLHPENSVLAGSYGYRVPDPVARVIGGNGDGGATVTQPAAGSATAGPFATGKNPVFTITASGSTATITAWTPGSTGAGSASGTSDDRRPGLIAAGIIAGLASLLALYLGYCAWLYRRQVRAYKTHLAVANRYSAADGPSASRGSFGGLAALFGAAASRSKSTRSQRVEEKGFYHEKKKGGSGNGNGNGNSNATALLRDHGPARAEESSTSATSDSFGWVPGQPQDAKTPFDDPSPSDLGHNGTAGGLRPPPKYPGWYSQGGGSGSTTAAAMSPGTHSNVSPGSKPKRSGSSASRSSADEMLDGQELSFFSVVMGPRRALRVVNGLEGE